MTESRNKRVEGLGEDELWDLQSIRQRPTRLNAKPIRQVMRKLMNQRGYGQTQAHESLQQHWPQAVGDELGAMTRPGNINRGVLTVYAESSIAAQELNFMKKQILTSLAAAFPQVRIVDLRTRVERWS